MFPTFQMRREENKDRDLHGWHATVSYADDISWHSINCDLDICSKERLTMVWPKRIGSPCLYGKA
jgi:hypothetical protein